MPKERSLLNNSVAQVFARILGSGCALILTFVIAQKSAADLGVFGTLFSFFLISEFIPLLGMQTFLYREVSQNQSQLNKLVMHAVWFSMVTSLAGIIILGLISVNNIYGEAISEGLFLIAAGLPATALSIVALSVLVGVGDATTFSMIQSGESIIRTIIGITIILLGGDIWTVILVMIIARWVTLIPYAISVRVWLKKWDVHFDWSYFTRFLSHVPIFAGITLMALILRFAAPTVVPILFGEEAAGQFRAGYVFVDLALLLPTAFTTNLVPILSRVAKDAPADLPKNTMIAVQIMAMGTIPIALCIATTAPSMFSLLFPNDPSFQISAGILQIVIWVCVLQSIDQVLSATIVSDGKQKMDLIALSVGVGFMLVFYSILLPQYGLIGIAWALLLSSFCLVLGRVFINRSSIGNLTAWSTLWRPIAAGAGSLVISLSISPHTGVFTGAVSVAAYLLALWFLGMFKPTRRNTIIEFLNTRRSAL